MKILFYKSISTAALAFSTLAFSTLALSTLALSTLALSAPALAQETETASASSESAVLDPARPDANRLAAASKTIDYLFPLGTYERMMKGTMDQIMDSVLGGLGNMTMGDMASGSGIDDADMSDEDRAKTIAEISREADPHFEERMKISTAVMMDEMVTLMSSMEPAIRETLVSIYARKYDAAQLAEMNAFFATDTGTAFARDYMMVFVDPEMMQSMMGMVPKMMQSMPDIMKKVEDATSHLPPVKMPQHHRHGHDDAEEMEEL